jgi:hypothetical protein
MVPPDTVVPDATTGPIANAAGATALVIRVATIMAKILLFIYIKPVQKNIKMRGYYFLFDA